MTDKEFSQALHRGLGSAILELKNNANKSEYHDIILRCCLRNISYDQQSEGTRGYYLYNAILTTGKPEFFEDFIIDKFLSHCNYGLLCQLASILYGYAYDESNRAKDALHAKYRYFAAKKGRFIQRPPIYEGWQWDEVAYRLSCIDGFAVFEQFATDIGKLRQKSPDNRKVFDPWYIHRAEDLFSKKRIDIFFKSTYEKSDAIKALVDSIKTDELSDEQGREQTKQGDITALALMQAAIEAATNNHPLYQMHRNLEKIGLHYSFSFVRQASDAEILKLANFILRDQNETVKALLLNSFHHSKPYPLEITPLIEYAQSDSVLLAESAIRCLEKFKDRRLHDLAMHLLKTKGLKSFALALLIKNYKKSDDAIITGIIKKSTNIPHHVQQNIRDIYDSHRSTHALPLLLCVYRKGECSFCRKGIVEAMNHCGVLTDEILEECQFDSDAKIRQYAKKHLARRQRNK